MKSGKQRRIQLKAKRAEKRAETEPSAARKRVAAEQDVARERAAFLAQKEPEGVAVDQSALAPYNRYGDPGFVERGYYVVKPIACEACDAEEVWTAQQQKCWYELAKGSVYSTARLRLECRRRE
jgi:hypothetical protein